jgi:hypothetical protein
MLGAQLKPPQTGKFCRRARNRWQGPRAAAGTRLSHKPLIGKSIFPDDNAACGVAGIAGATTGSQQAFTEFTRHAEIDRGPAPFQPVRLRVRRLHP